jgi:hypothetical protein
MNGFSLRVFGFIFLVCIVEGVVIDARDHNTKICSIKNIRVVTEEQIGMDSIDNIGMTEVTILFSQIDEPVPDDLETARIKISGLGQRRHLKVWHDHSDILNRTYVSTLYYDILHLCPRLLSYKPGI